MHPGDIIQSNSDPRGDTARQAAESDLPLAPVAAPLYDGMRRDWGTGESLDSIIARVGQLSAPASLVAATAAGAS